MATMHIEPTKVERKYVFPVHGTNEPGTSLKHISYHFISFHATYNFLVFLVMNMYGLFTYVKGEQWPHEQRKM